MQPVLTRASLFPDVPEDYIHREAVERLANVQVINGNPDGTFLPDASVNRAAMLKMLYKASGRTPDPSNVDCFDDVVLGSWYEPFVCDAEANRLVQGYSDGKFRPDNPVNRTEALKMTMLTIGIDVPELTSINREVLKFVDISTSAWYTKYLSAAFTKGVLPIAGQSGPRFYPDWPLSRGEAAAYIVNALDIKFTQEKEELQKGLASSAGGASSTAEGFPATGGGASSAAGSSASVTLRPEATQTNVNFPFDVTGTFEEKASQAYRFMLSKTTTLDATAAIKAGQGGKISCRLYKLTKDGFSEEYYLGFQESQSCYLLTTLTAGDYQLQLEPTTPNTSFTLAVKAGLGDGNDGFSEARNLTRGNLKTEILSPNDYEDWFKFTLSRDTELTFKVVSSFKVRCLIYPGSDVDVFGFAGPQCGETYLYPAGSYIVGIGHAVPRAARQTYTIQLK